MKSFSVFALSLSMLFVCSTLTATEPQVKKEVPPVLNFKVNSLAGEEVDLSKYQGDVLLIVNVASKCGYTPQYKDLQALHDKYSAKGLKILAFPCNQFGGQEPGSATQIQEFCSSKYGVKFDMFEKVDVNGPAASPLYKFLTSKETSPSTAGNIKWNFEKFLIGKDGKVIARFPSKDSPTSDKVVNAIEAALK